MEDDYTKLKDEVYKTSNRIQSQMKHKKWIKSSAFKFVAYLDQVCKNIDTSNQKERPPTRINVYDYGFEIGMSHNSDKITNTCIRYEDVLNIEHDQDMSSLFVLFRSNNDTHHYVYPDVSEFDYVQLKERYLDMK